MKELNSLDAAFELPEIIKDAKLRELYEVIVFRLRDEAKMLPMNTVQQLLIERIAYNYIVMRYRERGELGGFTSATVQRDYNTFWLSMTQEFNRLLSKTTPMGDSERKALFKEVQGIIVNTVSSAVSDPQMRSELLVKMATAFDTAGI